jgi:hypothetical protein
MDGWMEDLLEYVVEAEGKILNSYSNFRPKRKEENGRRERTTTATTTTSTTRDPDDNISLRPHSGNFSGGCGSNFPVAYGYKERGEAASNNVGGLQQIIDEHFLR